MEPHQPVKAHYTQNQSPSHQQAHSKYLAIDLASNKSSINVQNYVIDKVAPTIIKTNPKYNAINVPLTTPLTITFSENILKGINYNDIYVKNVNTGKLVQITKNIIQKYINNQNDKKQTTQQQIHHIHTKRRI